MIHTLGTLFLKLIFAISNPVIDSADETIGKKTDAILWLQADKGVRTDQNNPVSFWEDQSCDKNDAYQKESKLRPVLYSNRLKDRPVVRFDGVNDYLKVDKLNLDATARIEVFIVFKCKRNDNIVFEHNSDINSNLSGFYMIDHYKNSKSGLSVALKGDATRGCGYPNGQNNQSALFTNFHSKKFKLVNMVIDKSAHQASQVTIKVHNRKLSSNTYSYYSDHSDRFSKDDFYKGGRFHSLKHFLNGEFAELIVFPKILDHNRSQEVNSYFESKYF